MIEISERNNFRIIYSTGIFGKAKVIEFKMFESELLRYIGNSFSYRERNINSRYLFIEAELMNYAEFLFVVVNLSLRRTSSNSST